ncbi:MAG: HyaD/HybD family hydrogenase maturation endopeptidase [Gammaproteobacteria bacterium]|nr:HyaD/HybD family hydrogenase maturation endopeptidase [Gammaproteobacteria bacterium]MBU1600735.1 HyaD/HybD family hydrogenase maturation endopeptidase [Gammaproteobacteria bacterium]MBU2435191.1 HyaD/HybD family hydrogenase maturation endopeptidase [Gammaproteobacteria bacterium]MBU2448605.1 HyaD/HybD family hydrogenase maturation endopeptidase [Gammaproteobacteria bacterium]
MTPKRILVLGIGNILWADEGFGVRCVEALNAGWEFPPQVTVMDGGTQGLYLLPYVQEADCLLVFDAVDYGDEPGSLRVVVGDQVPRFMGVKKMSLHQTGFQEVLMAAELTQKLPAELVLVGVQAEQLEDFGGSLRDVVKAQMVPALNIALDWLEKWGAAGRVRDGLSESITDNALAMDVYESERPPAELAYRLGDARFLNMETA